MVCSNETSLHKKLFFHKLFLLNWTVYLYLIIIRMVSHGSKGLQKLEEQSNGWNVVKDHITSQIGLDSKYVYDIIISQSCVLLLKKRNEGGGKSASDSVWILYMANKVITSASSTHILQLLEEEKAHYVESDLILFKLSLLQIPFIHEVSYRESNCSFIKICPASPNFFLRVELLQPPLRLSSKTRPSPLWLTATWIEMVSPVPQNGWSNKVGLLQMEPRG